MSHPRYRSYVIRSWTTRHEGDERAHVRIELVESGEQLDLRGAPASRLAASVEAAIRDASCELPANEEAPAPLADEPLDGRSMDASDAQALQGSTKGTPCRASS